jgi:predicted PurR-regulated permease PerM
VDSTAASIGSGTPPSPRRVEFPPTWHAVIFGSVLVGLVVLVIVTQEALAPYIIGLILIFLLNGLVDRLQRAGIPRWGGTLIAILALIVAVFAFVYFILDALLDQLSALVASLPEIATVVGDFLRALALPEGVEAALAAWVEGLPAAVPDLLAALFGFVVSGVGGLVALVIAWAGIPFFIFYALSDSPKLLSGLREAVPRSFRVAVFDLLGILGDVFAAWARGTALIAGIVFVPFVIGFLVFGALIDPDIGEYALLFAFTLAISELIPVIGPILALIPILVITAVIAGLPGMVAVGLLFIVIEQIDGAVVQPKVQGHVLDLHPAVILPALVVGSALAGIMGAVLALPLTAAARQSIGYLLRMTDGEPEPRPTATDPAEPQPAPSGPSTAG